jgi:hypothetical protein
MGQDSDRGCNCQNKEQCNHERKQVLELAPEKHPWTRTNGIFQLRKDPACPLTCALWHAVALVCGLSPEQEKEKKTIRIAWIHFADSSFPYGGHWAKAFATRFEAEEADSLRRPGPNWQRLSGDENCVANILRELDFADVVADAYASYYLKAPLVQLNEVHAKVHTWQLQAEHARIVNDQSMLETSVFHESVALDAVQPPHGAFSPDAQNATPSPHSHAVSSASPVHGGIATPSMPLRDVSNRVSNYPAEIECVRLQDHFPMTQSRAARDDFPCVPHPFDNGSNAAMDTSFVNRSHDFLNMSYECGECRPDFTIDHDDDADDLENAMGSMSFHFEPGVVADLSSKRAAAEGIVVEDASVEEIPVEAGTVVSAEESLFGVSLDDASSDGTDDSYQDDMVEDDVPLDEPPQYNMLKKAMTYLFSRQGSEETIRNMCEEHEYDKEKLRADESFMDMLRHVRGKFPDWKSMSMRKGKNMLLCETPETEGCEQFKFQRYKVQDGTLYRCDNRKCRRAYQAQKRKEERQRAKQAQKDAHDVTQPDSHCNFRYLSPSQLRQRMRRMNAKVENLKRKVLRLSCLLEQKEDFILDLQSEKDKDVVEELKEMLERFKDPKEADRLRSEVVKTLIGSHKSYTGQNDEKIKKELDAYADQIVCTLNNYAKRISGKDKQCRFNSNVLRTALAMWLSSPTTYNVVRSHSIEMLPSARTLHNLQKRLISHEGCCPETYGWLEDIIQDLKDHKWFGAITCDEMHLKTDMQTNVKNNKTYGFAESEGEFGDRFKLGKELKKLYNETARATNPIYQPISTDDDDDEEEPRELPSDVATNFDHHAAKKVHFFRLRDHSKHAANLEYWFNSGTLTGSTILLQLLHVIYHCELIGIPIYQIVADSGGSNSALFRALRERKSDDILDQVEWLDERVCSFRNPCDKSRRVYITPCSVHLLKSMRNALLKSHVLNVRQFNKDDVTFGWSQVLEVFFADQENKPATRTDLTAASVNPDNANKMHVKEAKAPFTYKTLMFFCSLIANALPDYSAKQLAIDLLPLEQAFGSEGYDADKLEAALEILRVKVKEVGKENEDLHTKFACLEYCVAVHGIFIARFLNYKAVIVEKLRPNQPRVCMKKGYHFLEFHAELERMKRYLDYFQGWRQQALERKAMNENKWEKTCISRITYQNLRHCISGFLSYSRAILAIEGGPTYVPYRLANQSTVENIFSQIRGKGKDTAQKFAKGILAIDVAAALSTDHLKSGRSYCWDLLNGLEGHFDGMGMIDKRRDKQRQEIFDAMLVERKAKKDACPASQEPPPTQPQEADIVSTSSNVRRSTRIRDRQEYAALYQSNDDAAYKHWQERLFPTTATHHFTDILLEDDVFPRTVKTSVFSAHKQFFHSLLTLASHDEEEVVDKFCRRIVDGQLKVLMSDKKAEKIGDSLLKLLLSDEFDDEIALLPKEELHDACGAGLVALALNRMLLTRIREELTKASHEKIAWAESLDQVDPEGRWSSDTKMLVNRFVGYGLSEIIKFTVREADKENDQMERDNEEGRENVNRTLLKFLRSMRIFHEQALFLPDYVDDFYDDVFMLQNHGFLALVDPDYTHFGYELMSLVRGIITPGRILREGSNALANMKAELSKHVPALVDALEVGRVAKQKRALEQGSTDQEPAVDLETRTFCVEYILWKVSHAYFGCCEEDARQPVQKFGSDYTPATFRTYLRVLSANTGSVPSLVMRRAANGR